MKQFFFISLTLFVLAELNAQPEPHRDTTWSASPHRPYLLSIMQAPVLEGRTPIVTIVPRERMCFDKVFKVKTETSGGIGEGCLFINTDKGLMANTPMKRGTAPPCDLNINRAEFSLFLLSLKGNTYNYFNAKKNDRLEHWVTTGNSETYQYQLINTNEPIPLTRRPESKLFFGGKVKAWAYKAAGRTETWWLFGKTEPQDILMTPKKFLGGYAVGYQFTDKGLFIILQVTTPSYSAEVTDIQEVSNCFNTAAFKIFEAEQSNGMMASLRREREKIAREEAKPEDDPSCQVKKTQLIHFQKEALNRREQNVQQAKVGNAQQEVRTQKAQANHMNYDDMIQQMIYETELQICRAQKQQMANPSSLYEQKINCLQATLSFQRNTQQKFHQINTQYRNDPGKQQAEKTKQMMQAIRPCN